MNFHHPVQCSDKETWKMENYSFHVWCVPVISDGCVCNSEFLDSELRFLWRWTGLQVMFASSSKNHNMLELHNFTDRCVIRRAEVFWWQYITGLWLKGSVLVDARISEVEVASFCGKTGLRLPWWSQALQVQWIISASSDTRRSNHATGGWLTCLWVWAETAAWGGCNPPWQL